MNPVLAMLRHATGLNLSKAVVERAIKQRVEQLAAASHDDYLAGITPEELAALVELVVVPESWFYRDPQAFQATIDFARGHASSGRVLRMLSIPCAGGEEPYTLAMAMTDAGLAASSYTIDAYDISAACVERARDGLYGRNAFRNQDLGFRDRHFSSIGNDEYRISDAIRAQVRFKQGNLLELDLAGRSAYYDVIFCRNLLIYFDKPTTKAAIEKLRALLADEGLLFAGYAEVPSFCNLGFTPLQYPQAFGLQKEAARSASPGAGVRAARAVAPRAQRTPEPDAPHAPTAGRSAASIARKAAPVSSRASSAAARPQAAAARAAGSSEPATQEQRNTELLEQARKLADLGQFKEADGKCREHLARQPDSAEAYFILGLLSEHANKPELAQDNWRRCIYLQPDHYEALCHLALLAEANSDSTAAAALKARAARIYKRQQAS